MYRDSVLLSIKPKYCELIMSGKKTLEVRKSKPKIDVPFICYIYCTISGDASEKMESKKGNIIGEFECDRIDAFKVFENGAVQNWNFSDLDRSCLTYDEISQYIGRGKTGYAWHISNLKIYNKPMELESAQRCRKCQYYNTCDEHELSCSGEYMITQPPLSWCYCG